jgi:hypothetical protein
MLKAIISGTCTRCKAKAKSTGEQCKCPCAYGQAVCHKHGAHKPETILKGKDHHWFKNGFDTRKSRREQSAKLKELKQCEKLLAGDKPIFELPSNTPIAKALNKAMDIELEKIIKRTVKIIDKKHKAAKKKSVLVSEKENTP